MARALVLTSALVVAACAGTHFDWQTARQIQPGMSEAQLTQLMGAPYMVKSEGGVQTWIWSYASGWTGSVRTVSVQLKDGAVVAAPAVPQAYQ